jgi:DNA-binding NtrC family response regulator
MAMALPRVLVIDDEQLLGQTIQLGLEDTMEVELETSGEKGLARLLADDQFELILCDLSLPDLSGSDIYARVASVKPELKDRFVVMTGGAVTNESRDFLDNYQGHLLNKPFTLSQVEALIDRVVGTGRARSK